MLRYRTLLDSLTNTVKNIGSSRFVTSMQYDYRMASRLQTSTIRSKYSISPKTQKVYGKEKNLVFFISAKKINILFDYDIFLSYL